LLGAVVLLLLANDTWFRSGATNGLSRWDSLILLFFFGLFLLYTARLAKKGEVEASDVKLFSLPITISAIVVGLVGLIFGGKIVVSQAVLIASSLGVSQKIIGLTIVAAGTSLPELATSITAALKKHPDIAIGNIVGSNIFNIMLILGLSSMLKPLPYNNMFNTDIYVLFVTTAVLFLFMFSVKKLRLDRIEGAIFLLMYVAYVVFFLK
jgi:cation:H+ antiporter